MAQLGGESLEQQLDHCEKTIDDILRDRLGDSKSTQRNEKLRECIRTLQSITDAVERLSLFSTNDVADELPTSSLRFLLIPAYLAYALEEILTEMDKRKAFLKAAKSHFREFLQNLLIFELINFKLSWFDIENQGEGNSGINTHLLMKNSLADAEARRQQKIARIEQIKQLEGALERLKIEQRRGGDEAEQREIVLTLLRLWSIRAMKDLEMIEEELSMLEQYEASSSQKCPGGGAPAHSSKSMADETIRLKPFVIAKSEEQKRVFGLGYPSIPTLTVDQWAEQTYKKGGGSAKRGPPSSFTIDQPKRGHSDDEEDEEEDEGKRQAQIRRDEWKDVNRRGWGNTYNKG